MTSTPVAPYRVLVTCGVFEPGFRAGGPIRSVARIVDTVSDDVEILLVTSDRDAGDTEPYPNLSGRWVHRGRTRIYYLDTRSVRQWLRLWRDLRSAPADLLYVNSLLAPTFSLVPILAMATRLINPRKVLIAPRGELSPGALELKSGKKKTFLKMWMPVLRRLDTAWHASAPMEKADIKRLCPTATVEIVGDQTALPDEPYPVEAAVVRPARMVFISRISPKKNLDLLLAALQDVDQPVDLDIYGPLEDPAYWKHCQALAATHPAHVRAVYRGELTPAAVRETFSRYDLFAFPTRGENFGHVIAESLSASCPVLCSDQTPWSKTLNTGGGIVVEKLNEQALGRELARVAGLSPEERLAMRREAGEAYRRWRAGVVRENILDRVRRH